MVRWAALIGVVACSSAAPPQPERGAEPGRGAAYSMKAPTPELEQAAAPFSGSCAFAKPPGERAGYGVRVRAVRRAAVFASSSFEVGAENHIGVVDTGVSLWAAGPVASSQDSERGYAVLLIDNHSRVCRGYVAEVGVAPIP